MPYSSTEHSAYRSCNMIIMEHVEGVTLEEFVCTATCEQMKVVIIQMIDALYDAYEKIRFTHYDLALVNIIIKPDLTPVFIDFDGSFMEYRTPQGELVDIVNFPFAMQCDWKYDISNVLAFLSEQLDYNINIIQRLKCIHMYIIKYYEWLQTAIKENTYPCVEIRKHEDLLNNAQEELRQFFLSNNISEDLIPPKSEMHTLNFKDLIPPKSKIPIRAYDMGPIIAELLQVLKSEDNFGTFVSEAHKIIKR